ncbi:O-antigen ligase family protein [Aureispira sp. CCB-E]|uniref:O-antigen ligase family protein n=1 Tax=Aureispira sp. CCB-E TaxID=3051121 RepID=UPI00286889EF|nr:O-antigen ligase family protein [Aureispira sp. CCB-E]WMX16939.1 O-antigen ligase family protein [Aureispira sp. CCB-E]
MLLSQRVWAGMLLLLPLIMTYGSLVDAVSIPRVTFLLISVVCTNLYLLIKERQTFLEHTQQFFSNPLGMSLTAYLLIGLCSLGGTLSLSEGIWEWLKLVGWLNVIWLSSFLLKEKGSLLLFMKASIVALLVVEVIGLKEFASIFNRLEEDKILYFVNSTFEHKNLLATGLVMSLPFSFIVFRLENSRFWKLLAGLVFGVGILLILITQSRAAWLALGGGSFFALICLLLTSAKRNLILQARYWLMGGGVLALSVGLVWFLSSQNNVANAPVERIQALFTYEDTKNEHTETIKERLLLWNNTVEMIKERPFRGVGLGNWKIHFPKYNIAGLRSEQGEVFFQRPHNDYLWVASEMGILGLVAYLLILLSALYYATQVLKRTTEEEHSTTYAITIAMAAGLVAFMLFSLFDFPKERPIHLLWSGVIIAYIISTYQQLYSNQNNKKKSFQSIGSIAYVLPLLAVLGVAFSAKRWQFERQLKVALGARSQQQYLNVLATLESINPWVYELDPSATPIDCYRGEALYLQKRFPEALVAYQNANAVHPYHIHTLNNLATTYFGLQDIEASKKHFEQVLHFAPHFPDANMNMAAIAYNQKEIQKAIKYIGNCVPKNYQDSQFLQFLKAISASYASFLAEKEALQSLVPFIQQFGKDEKWQIRMHEQAHQYNRTYEQQIHLDLLFVAKEQQAITEEESNRLTPILNKFLNH